MKKMIFLLVVAIIGASAGVYLLFSGLVFYIALGALFVLLNSLFAIGHTLRILELRRQRKVVDIALKDWEKKRKST